MANGILIVDKPAGWTSQDVAAKLRGVFHERRIGHSGTLDPMATGVLVLFVGRATRAVEFAESDSKEYLAGLRLGLVTNTQDTSGETLETHPVAVTREELDAALDAFRGDISQIPPMYSALKVNGQKLCDLARAGKEVERKPRRVTIREIRIEKIDLPRVTMEVTCSKGTYIRTLCQDIGENLGCGGCMESLLRTRVERFSLEDAIKLGEVEAIKAEKGLDGLMEKILPIDGMFPDALKAVVPEEGMKALVNGNSLKENQIRPERAAADNERVRVYDEAGRFYALYRYEAAEKQYRLEKMFYDREEEQDGIHTGAGRTLYQR